MGKKGDKLTGAASVSAETLQAKLIPLGDIRLRKMFGGYGIFEEDTMFALVDSVGVIFLKVDENNLKRFEEAGANKHGRMPYYQIPVAVLADEALLREWAQTSITIARHAK
jgi:DNA transformation protein and related proteins